MERIEMRSAGDRVECSSTPQTAGNGSNGATVYRDETITFRRLVDLYMAAYTGRDPTRVPRLAWWVEQIGDVRVFTELDDDEHLYRPLEELASQPGRYFAGRDADGNRIFKRKKKPVAPATVNRTAAALAAVLTWSIKKRIAPKGWTNPMKRIERRREDNAVERFLTDAERERLLDACRRSKWNKLYLFVVLAGTTGARRGELEGLRWRDLELDAEQPVAKLHTSKNGEPRMLPLTPAVVEELRRHAGAPADALVFASPRRPNKAFNFEAPWRAALAEARVRRFRVHDLRHTCASYLARHGASLHQIAMVLGHKNLATSRRYSHLCVADKAKLVNGALADLFT